MLLLPLLGCGSPTPTDAPAPSWESMGVHPWAEVQRTPLGRVLWTLTAYDSHVIPGFGDWNDNTGPIRLMGVTPEGAWSDAWNHPTEAATVMRILDDELWVPPIDPFIIEPGDFAVASPGLSWRNERLGEATHVFDIVTDGEDLLATGSIDLEAVVWRRTDGNWTVDRREAHSTGDFARYYGLAWLDDTLYLQRADAGGGPVAEALAYRDGSYAPAPRMLPDDRAYVFRPERFGDRLVYQSDTPFGRTASELIAYDGTGWEQVFDGAVRSFTVTADAVYVLDDDLGVFRSTDLASWELVTEAPRGCWSLAWLEGLWCGTGQSEVFFRAEP